MGQTHERRKLRRLFQAGVVLKAIDGVFEVVAGALLILFSTRLTGLAERLARHELSEDRHDALARAIERIPYVAQHSHVFASVYLLGHGVVKIVLAVALLKNQRWAYPTALVVFIAFIAYELHRYSHTRSIALLVFTVFDAVVVLLIWHEWRSEKRAGA